MGDVTGLVADTDDLDRLERLPAEVEEGLGPIEVLITNTGGPPFGAAREHGPDTRSDAYPTLVLAPPVGVVVTLAGVPSRLTDAIVGVPPVATVFANALPLFQPSKYRMIPFRAQGVRTGKFVEERCKA